ncbi:MAG: nickel pincer cofactor biosynthesis protein LarC [Polyangia bacterium]
MTKNEDRARSVLYLDCFSGLAGDMIVASLVDLGVPFETVEEAVEALQLPGCELRLERVERESIDAARFVVEVDRESQPHRRHAEIARMIERSDLAFGVKRRALEVFAALARAEARVHGMPVDDVHFHEVGAVDSIADIVGAAAALERIDADVVCAPIPVGRGFVEAQHGTLPVPAPATLHLLRGASVIGTEVEAELTTPTGAALAVSAASCFGPLPAMVIEAVGFGAGTREIPGRPGLLRAVLGRPEPGSRFELDCCRVLEANIDDITGEVAAEAAAALLEAGALDAWITPIQMKKGRPALTLSVLCRREDFDRIAGLMLGETTSIGLRHYPVGRVEMRRRILTVETSYGPVRVKLAAGPGGARNAAPELEDCKRIASERNVPLKRVLAAALGAAEAEIEQE